jgi:hypothetical protein
MDTNGEIAYLILRGKDEISPWLGGIRLDVGITCIIVIIKPFMRIIDYISNNLKDLV